MSNLTETYTAAHESALWRDMSHFGRFTVAGSDAAALLHHLTTNDIKGMKSGGGCEAVLLTSKARILDWLSIYRLDDKYVVLTSPNRRDLFKPHAQKFILFRQQIEISDVTESTTLFGLFGPRSLKVLTSLGMPDLSGKSLDEPVGCTVDGVELYLARTSRLPGGGVLLGSADGAGLRRLVQSSGYRLCDNETYNVLRVETGIPVAGLELTEEINPWEANFDAAISLHKGCYNGQEVVARLNTYQKVKQRLFGLRLERPTPMGRAARLAVENRDAGVVTSSVDSPRCGPIALAYIRSDFQDAGQKLNVMAEDGNIEQTAVVSALPFVGETEKNELS